MNRRMQKLILPAIACMALALGASAQSAPEAPKPGRAWDAVISYQAARTNTVHPTRNFWLQGGSAQTSVRVWKNLRAVADFSGSHNGNMDGLGVGLDLTTLTFGPGYQWRPCRSSKYLLYGDALFGVAHGFNSVFVGSTTARHSANSFALKMGGGVDYSLNHRFSLRMFDMRWARTQMSNGSTSVQNHLQMGAGLVIHLR